MKCSLFLSAFKSNEAHERHRQFHSQNKNGGTGHRCAFLDLFSYRISPQTYPQQIYYSPRWKLQHTEQTAEGVRKKKRKGKKRKKVTFVQRKEKPFNPPPSTPNAAHKCLPGQSGTHVPDSIQSPARACPVGMHREGRRCGAREKGKEESRCEHGNTGLSNVLRKHVLQEKSFSKSSESCLLCYKTFFFF